MADLLSALAHIHSHEIAHRDVKANVLLTKHGRAVLTDFGLAAPTSDAEAMCKLCGTPGYAAPEVITRKQPGVKIDIFSAGATLYFILCGRLPFRGSSVNSVLHRTLKKEVSFDVHPEFSQVSAQCNNFMCQLLQKDLHNRLTAEQAASQMWGSNNDMECGQHKKTSNAVNGCPSSSMSETGACSQFVSCGHYDPHARSACCPNLKGEEGHAGKDNLDSTSDPLRQRGSMPNLTANKADGQASHSSCTGMVKGRVEKSEPRPCETHAFHTEAINGDRSIMSQVADNYASVKPPSEASGVPNSRRMRGQAGRLLQALSFADAARVPQTHTRGGQPAAGSALTVVPPAWRPEDPRPQTRSLWGWLRRGRNRKEEHSDFTNPFSSVDVPSDR